MPCRQYFLIPLFIVTYRKYAFWGYLLPKTTHSFSSVKKTLKTGFFLCAMRDYIKSFPSTYQGSSRRRESPLREPHQRVASREGGREQRMHGDPSSAGAGRRQVRYYSRTTARDRQEAERM